MFSKSELIGVYNINFLLMDKFNYDIKMLDDLIPYEREIYINLKINQLQSESKK